MARSYAPLMTTIWADEDFVALSPEAQRVYLLALSQPNITYCGVVAYTPRRWARMSAGTGSEDISYAITDLANAGFIHVDLETEELFVRSFVRHNGVLGQPQLTKAMVRAYEEILSPRLRAAFLAELPEALPKGAEALEEPRREAAARVPEGYEAGPGNDLPRPSPQPSSSSPPAEDDDEVLAELGQLRLEARKAADCEPIGHVASWLRTTIENDRTTFNGQIGEARQSWPFATNAELARFLFDGTEPRRYRCQYCGTEGLTAEEYRSSHGDACESELVPTESPEAPNG